MLSGLDSCFHTTIYKNSLKNTVNQTIRYIRGLFMGHLFGYDYSMINTV